MSIPNHVLYANEVGAGRGHIKSLVDFSAKLGRDLPSIAAIANHIYADDLAEYGITPIAGPRLGFTRKAMEDFHRFGNASWADYLFAIGLDRPDTIRKNLMWWINTIYTYNVSILVAEYAPMALLAAKAVKLADWDIEVVAIGSGYSVPPSHLAQFPQLMPQHSRIVTPEPAGLAQLNSVLAEFGMPALPNLSAIYDVDLALPMTFPFLDPYDGLRQTNPLCPPSFPIMPQPTATGTEVFIYFAESELDNPELVSAILNLPLPRRAHLPQTRPEILAKLADSGVIIEPNLLPIDALISQTRVFLHTANHGMICVAALAGIAQIAIPQHLEHAFHGQKAMEKGILHMTDMQNITSASIISAIMRIYHDTDMHQHCQSVALDLQAQLDLQGQNSDIQGKIAALRARAEMARAG